MEYWCHHFQGESLNDIYNAILQFELVFDEEEWRDVSVEARDFVAKLIEPRTDIRLTPPQALRHTWIRNIINTKTRTRKADVLKFESLQKSTQIKPKAQKVLRILADEGKIAI